MLVFIVSFLVAHAYAAGPILVDTSGTGKAVTWQDGVVHFNLESGTKATLGQLTNEQAIDLVKELFNNWLNTTINSVSTVSLTLDQGKNLGEIDTTNLDTIFTYCPTGKTCQGEAAPFVTGSARSGDSPIVFDDDGSLTNMVLGQGASDSVLGFAGPRVIENSGGTLYITESQAILNGKFINGVNTSADPEVSIAAYKGAIFHEIGHFMGLDHTQVNLASVNKYLRGDTSEKEAIPTMFPLFVDGEAQLTPHFDDKVAVSMLYPSAQFTSSFCSLQGKVFASDGSTELQGVNVVVSNAQDPLNEATSFVSGSLFTGTASKCTTAAGSYQLNGLIPGNTYSLSIEKISQSFTGGSSIEPCDPPQSGFTATTISGTFSCSTGNSVITTGSAASSSITTTKTASTTTTSTESSTPSSGGCSLVPSF